MLDSVAPLVKTISLGSAEINLDIYNLASSTAFSVYQPKEWDLECGLPY